MSIWKSVKGPCDIETSCKLRKTQKCQHGNSLCSVVCKVPEKDKESSRLVAAMILFDDIPIMFLFGKQLQECALTLKLRKLGTAS